MSFAVIGAGWWLPYEGYPYLAYKRAGHGPPRRRRCTARHLRRRLHGRTLAGLLRHASPHVSSWLRHWRPLRTVALRAVRRIVGPVTSGFGFVLCPA